MAKARMAGTRSVLLDALAFDLSAFARLVRASACCSSKALSFSAAAGSETITVGRYDLCTTERISDHHGLP